MSQDYLARLKSAAVGRGLRAEQEQEQDAASPAFNEAPVSPTSPDLQAAGHAHAHDDEHLNGGDNQGDEQLEGPDSDVGDSVSAAVDARLQNPLATPSHTTDSAGRPCKCR